MIMSIIRKLIIRRVEARTTHIEPSNVPKLREQFHALLEEDGEMEPEWKRQEDSMDGKRGVITS